MITHKWESNDGLSSPMHTQEAFLLLPNGTMEKPVQVWAYPLGKGP